MVYPGLRANISDDVLIDEALREHPDARERMARMESSHPMMSCTLPSSATLPERLRDNSNPTVQKHSSFRRIQSTLTIARRAPAALGDEIMLLRRACLGYALIRHRVGAMGARVLISTMFWIIVAYFVWHSRHAPRRGQLVRTGVSGFHGRRRVAAVLVQWEERQQRLVDFCRRWAMPSGVVLFALLVVQANTGALTGYPPRCYQCAASASGWRTMADEIEAVRAREGASCVLAPDYGTTGWLAFYLPRALASRSRVRASAGSTCPSRHLRSSPENCCTSTRLGPAIRRSDGQVCEHRESRRGQAQARASDDRDLRARCTGSAEGRRVRSLATAGAGSRGEASTDFQS